MIARSSKPSTRKCEEQGVKLPLEEFGQGYVSHGARRAST